MPAVSKSQQHLFGAVRAYQEGHLKHPSAKIKEVAEHISPESAGHFAETKTKKLPEHVKKAECKCGKCKPCKVRQMQKESFELGFVKAAEAMGVDPVNTAYLYKQAGLGTRGYTVDVKSS